MLGLEHSVYGRAFLTWGLAYARVVPNAIACGHGISRTEYRLGNEHRLGIV